MSERCLSNLDPLLSRIQPLVDFASEVHESIGKYTRSFILDPKKLMGKEYIVDCLTWDSIRYGDSEINRVPNDKRGVYAFAVCQESNVLPPHGYVLYIGIAGRDSDRSLRDRYRDYLSPSRISKRDRVKIMIGTWHQVLRFFFAPVDDDVSSEDLQRLERQLNTALVPPYSEADIDATVRRHRRAFR